MKKIIVRNISVIANEPTQITVGSHIHGYYKRELGVEYQLTAYSEEFFSHQELVERIENSCPMSRFTELAHLADEYWDIIANCPEAMREYEKRKLVKEMLK